MENKRKPIIQLIAVLAMTLCILPFAFAKADAASTEKTITPETTKYLTSGETIEISFTTFDDMVFMLPIKIEMYDNIKSGGFRIILQDENGIVHQDDAEGLKGYRYDETYESWFYNDEFILPRGTYTYTIENTSNGSFECEYSVIGFTKVSTNANIKAKVTAKSGTWIKVGKIGEGLPYYENVKTSNKKVAVDFYVESDRNAYVFARGKGKATVSFKLQNGKKYSTKVTVKPGYPDLRACLSQYNRGKNYFVVRLKNCGEKSVTILTKGSKVVDGDKNDTRRLRAPSKVTIKPGQSKKIKFHVVGKKTYPKVKVYTLYAKLRYEGKTYQWHTWYEDSVIKMGKKWYWTYWDEDKYIDWL